MNRFGQLLLSILFIIFIFIFGIYKILAPDHSKSLIENRTLAQNPKISLATISDGTYMKEFEDYFIDQFHGRNVWLKSYIKYQTLTNKTFIYDYYITKDHFIMHKPTYGFDKKGMEATADQVNEFGKYLKGHGIELYYFMLYFASEK